MTPRAALYARIAASDQESRSLVRQLERLQAYARECGWLVAHEQIYRDERVSGFSLDRPALGRLCAAVARGDVDAIIATAPDRLARDRDVLAQLLEEFGRSGVQVIFADREWVTLQALLPRRLRLTPLNRREPPALPDAVRLEPGDGRRVSSPEPRFSRDRPVARSSHICKEVPSCPVPHHRACPYIACLS